MLPAANRLIFPATRWLSFDCYGTLIDWKSGIHRVFGDFLKRRGKSADPKRLFNRWEKIQSGLLRPYRPYRAVLEESFVRTLKPMRIRVTSAEAKAFVQSVARWDPFPDVKPGLERLKNQYLIAIVSNIDEDLIKKSLRKIGVFFNAVVTSERVKEYKPGRGPFHELLRIAGSPPEEILHCAFGAPYDLAPASALGFKTAHIEREPVDLATLQPDFRFKTLTQMADLFLSQHRP